MKRKHGIRYARHLHRALPDQSGRFDDGCRIITPGIRKKVGCKDTVAVTLWKDRGHHAWRLRRAKRTACWGGEVWSIPVSVLHIPAEIPVASRDGANQSHGIQLTNEAAVKPELTVRVRHLLPIFNSKD